MALRVKDYKLRITQLPFFMDNSSFYNEDEKVTMMQLIVHRRGGKSTGCVLQDVTDVRRILDEKEIYKIRGDVDSSYPRFAFVAPTKLQARQIIWHIYRDLFTEFPGVHFNNSQLNITIPRPLLGDEMMVELMAHKNHDRLRGLKYRKVNFDETQDATHDAIYSSVLPTLKDSHGRANFYGTAKGHDELYKMAVNSIEQGYPVFLFPVWQTGVFTHEEIMEEKLKLTDGAFEREYELDYTAKLPGTFFHSTIEMLKMEDSFWERSTQENLCNVVGVDIGVGEGFAAWTAKCDGDNNLVHIQDFYSGYDNLLDLRKDFAADGFRPDVIFLPHDGNHGRIGTIKKDTPKKRFQEMFPECLVKVQKRTVELMTDIARVNENLHLLRFPPEGTTGTDAHLGLRQVAEFRRKKNKLTGAYMDAIDKNDGVDHAADALRTLFNGLNITRGKINRPYTYKAKGIENRPKMKTYTPWVPRLQNSGNIISTGGRFRAA